MHFKSGVKQTGTRSHRRWLVCDTTGQYWTGKRWGMEADALVFAGQSEALALAQKMNERRNRHVPVRRYTVEMVVEVRSESEIDREQIIDWLHRAADFSLDWQRNGSGPGESIVFVTTHWTTLTRSK